MSACYIIMLISKKNMMGKEIIRYRHATRDFQHATYSCWHVPFRYNDMKLIYVDMELNNNNMQHIHVVMQLWKLYQHATYSWWHATYNYTNMQHSHVDMQLNHMMPHFGNIFDIFRMFSYNHIKLTERPRKGDRFGKIPLFPFFFMYEFEVCFV